MVRQDGTGPVSTNALSTIFKFLLCDKFSSLTDFQANVIRLWIGFASVTEQDVLRFQITMDYALVLQRFHRPSCE